MAPGMHSVPLGRAAREVTAGAAADVSAVASLDEPTRRRIYAYVGAQDAPVSRDDVAVALDVPRRTAAFHLDRLSELGLLAVSFARRTGRNGPGAGRPAKLYQRSTRDVAVSLPPRDYDLAGRLLAGAMVQAQQTGERPREVLDRQARALGRAMGRKRSVGSAGQGAIVVLTSLLEDHGFEPRSVAGDIVQRAAAYGMPAERLDGVDFFGVHEAAGRAVARGRAGEGPSLLHIKLPRYYGHFSGDADTYRTAEEKARMLTEAAKVRSKNIQPALVVDLNCGPRDKELREL